MGIENATYATDETLNMMPTMPSLMLSGAGARRYLGERQTCNA